MREYVFSADNEAEARRKVEERNVVLGGIGSGANDKVEWVIEEADGQPQNIEIVK